MNTKIIALSLYPHEIDQLDALVEREKLKAINPKLVTRSSVIREWLMKEQIEFTKSQGAATK